MEYRGISETGGIEKAEHSFHTINGERFDSRGLAKIARRKNNQKGERIFPLPFLV
jgi:hypothetical protein